VQLSISLTSFLPSAVHQLIVAELKNRANCFADKLAADSGVILAKINLIRRNMKEFDKIFNNDNVSTELKSHLSAFYYAVIPRPINLDLFKAKMICLFEYLSSSDGRTDSHCRAVDSFMLLSDRWEKVYSDIPEKYSNLFSLAGELLHDTFSSPEIAKEYSATPEQLLEATRIL
jgi:hypothetical protein